MFLHLSIILFTGWWGWLPSMHHRSHDQCGSRSRGSASGGGGWADLPQVCLHGGGGVDPSSAYRGRGVGQTRDTWDTMGYGQRVGFILLECILVVSGFACVVLYSSFS